MTYTFRCNNIECKQNDKEFEIVCPVSERDKHKCLNCGSPLVRVYNAPMIKTGDGVK